MGGRPVSGFSRANVNSCRWLAPPIAWQLATHNAPFSGAERRTVSAETCRSDNAQPIGSIALEFQAFGRPSFIPEVGIGKLAAEGLCTSRAGGDACDRGGGRGTLGQQDQSSEHATLPVARREPAHIGQKLRAAEVAKLSGGTGAPAQPMARSACCQARAVSSGRTRTRS